MADYNKLNSSKMGAKELRQSNWVIFNDDTDRYGQVKEIHEYYAVLDCDYKPDHHDKKVTECRIDYEFIHGIPLTPEILKKAGFTSWNRTVSFNMGYEGGDIIYALVDGVDEFGQRVLRHGFIIGCVIKKKYSDDPTFSFWYGRGGSKKGVHIQHLHQLQNLYYALTGEELNINL